MKVKRFKNLWTMGLILCAVILVVIYIAKIFFPEMVVEIAQVESITKIGSYIDTHKWAWYLASGFLSFFAYYFYCCACIKKNKLNLNQILVIVSTIVILFIVKGLFPNQYTSINISSLVLLPFIMGGDFKATVVCFISTNFIQTITGEIRNIMSMVIDFNYATLIILMIDYYILEVLLYFLFNFKKEDK
jgi:hypothetical protein